MSTGEGHQRLGSILPCSFSFINRWKVRMDLAVDSATQGDHTEGFWKISFKIYLKIFCAVSFKRIQNSFRFYSQQKRQEETSSGLYGACRCMWYFTLSIIHLCSFASFVLRYSRTCSKPALPSACTDISLTSVFINLSVYSIRKRRMCYNNIPVTTHGSGPLWSWEGRISH